MEGFYTFKVTNSKTGEERDISNIIAKDHKNKILNSGLNAIATTSVCWGCKVGSGNTPVEFTQTDLEATVATTTTIQAETANRLATPPYYMWGRRTFRFAQGVAAGNLTEVGTYGSSSSSLFSRALIVDTEGNPTVLTILSDEWLDVTYELRIYQELTDTVLTTELKGVNHTVTIRPSSITSSTATNASRFFDHFLEYNSGYYSVTHYNGTIGTIESSPSGSSDYPTRSFGPYNPDTYEKQVILSSSLNNCNFDGGIGASVIRTEKAYWQLGYSPKIPKDGFSILVLNVTVSWGRHDPS